MNKLVELEFLSGDLSTQDAFTELYERLLNECQTTNDQEMLRAPCNGFCLSKGHS